METLFIHMWKDPALGFIAPPKMDAMHQGPIGVLCFKGLEITYNRTSWYLSLIVSFDALHMIFFMTHQPSMAHAACLHRCSSWCQMVSGDKHICCTFDTAYSCCIEEAVVSLSCTYLFYLKLYAFAYNFFLYACAYKFLRTFHGGGRTLHKPWTGLWGLHCFPILVFSGVHCIQRR